MVAPSPALRALQDRMKLAFDMHDFGVAAFRCSLRRREPQLSEEELGQRVDAWLGRHGFDPADHPGFRVREWPR